MTIKYIKVWKYDTMNDGFIRYKIEHVWGPTSPPCLQVCISSCKQIPFSLIDFHDIVSLGVGSCGETLFTLDLAYCHGLYF